MLRGLKAKTYNLTAVVTVADDGGLRRAVSAALDIIAPGGLRNCLVAWPIRKGSWKSSLPTASAAPAT